MRWYEYEITLDPGERIVNAVTAPIYPAIDENWEPALHEYTYLLSPAKKWAEFGTLDIVINTPYHITDSALGEFTETQNGYQQSFTGLPDGELSFTLCSADNPDYSPQTDTRPFSTLLRFTGIVILCVIAGIIAGVFISKKKGRNRLI